MATAHSEPLPDGVRPSNEAAFDLQRVLTGFRKHIRLFFAVFVVVTAFMAYGTLKSAPRYTATATVLINQHTPDAVHINTLGTQNNGQTQEGADSSTVDTQVEILKSRALASRVVDEFHLERDPEFNGALHPPGFLAKLIKSVRGEGAAVSPALAKQREYEGVVDAVLGDLAVSRAGLSYTIDLAVTAYDPSKAAAIANAFAQRYLTEGVDSKLDAAHTANAWLDTRMAGLRQQTEAADEAVQQYRIANNLLSAEGATLTEQEISSINTQLATARAEEAEQDARLKTAERQLAAGSNGGDIGEALNSPVIQSMRAQRAQASAHLADLQARYGDKHPEILKARRSLTDIDAQIQVEIQRVMSSLKAQSEVAHTRTQSLLATSDQTRGALQGNNRAMVRLNELQRNADAARAIYDAFLASYKQSTATEGLEQSDARIVSLAKLPTQPSKPNRKLGMMLAIAAGLACGGAAVLLTELLAKGVSTIAQVEEVFQMPALGEIPTLQSTLDGPLARRSRVDPVAYIAAKPLSRFAESFRNLHASILSSRTGRLVQIVAITSPLPNEGKTTTALCLARTLALSGHKVILLDCDLRQRSINRALASEPRVGLLEVLNGTARLDEALIRDPDSGAIVLPLAKSAHTPRDVFGSEAMGLLLQELRNRFEIILLDTAPVLAVADTRILCPRADAVLMVMRWRRTSRAVVRAALRALTGDTFIAGIVLTQVNIREQARAGESEAHYYRAYRKYYVG
jgi:succinoglycan biosynthesis transport protein ExoP